MSQNLNRMLLVVSILGGAGRSAAGQAPPAGPPPPRPQVDPGPALLLPPPPPPVPSRAPRAEQRASIASATIPLLPPPAGSPRPNAPPPRTERIALANPAPLTQAPPRAVRVRNFGGVVKTTGAEVAAPPGATGRCRDGTYVSGDASDASCGGRGGLAIHMPGQRKPAPAPKRGS